MIRLISMLIIIVIEIIILLLPSTASPNLTQNTTDDNKLYKNVIPCLIDENPECIHTDTDIYIDGYKITKNKHKTDGYLIDIENIMEPCSGIKRLLNKEDRVIAICDCSNTKFKQKNILSDCNIPIDNIIDTPFIHLSADPEWVTNFPYLLKVGDPEVSTKLSSLFNNPNRNIINPCNIDALTGSVISTKEAKLVKSTIYGKSIYFCKSYSFDIATIKYESDFLSNNNGLFANAVMRISHPSNLDPYYDEIQEWYIQGGSLISMIDNGTFTLPIIGSRINYKLDSINPKLYNMIETFYNKNTNTEINLLDSLMIYSFPSPKDILPFSIENYDLSNYKEVNDTDYPQIYTSNGVKRYSKDKILKVTKPNNCTTLLKNGIRPHKLINFSGAEIDGFEFNKLIYGGANVGCINDIIQSEDYKSQLDNIGTKNYFNHKLNNKYIVNPAYKNNTNVININHREQTIESVWYGQFGDDKTISKLTTNPLKII